MALVVPDQGEVEKLSRMLNKSATGDVVLRLYTNNYTPIEGSVVGDFTDATAAGYAAKTLTGSSWTISTVGNVSTAAYAEQTFTFTAGETCYGYFVTNAADDKVLWAELFTDGPYVIPAGGGDINVTPKIIAD